MAVILKGRELFDAVVKSCGLSALFAANSMKRACERAGVDPEGMSGADLRRALPEIRKALAPFLETGVAEAMQRLERLAR